MIPDNIIYATRVQILTIVGHTDARDLIIVIERLHRPFVSGIPNYGGTIVRTRAKPSMIITSNRTTIYNGCMLRIFSDFDAFVCIP